MSVLAIDQGTSSTRAILIDDAGRERTLLSRTHRQIYARPGWVEHDPEELIASLMACLDAATDEDVTAIGLDNQGESCLAWHADTKQALGPVIVWQDDRTARVTERLKAEGAEGFVRQRAGLPLDPYFSASKLSWMLDNLPDARALLAKGKLRLGTTDAFFRDRLTGRFETDPTTASRTSLMNLRTCTWDDDLCALFGVPPEALPAIRPSTGDLGGVLCGGRSAPLTASLVDQQASLYGHGCRLPGDAKITFGTGAFALVVTDGPPSLDAGGPVPTIAWQKHGELPTYAVDAAVYCASSAVSWAKGLGLVGDLSEISSFDGPPAIARGIVFVPALAGLACPHWDRRARGAWIGLSLDTGPRDLMQAVLEGIAFRMREAIASVEATTPLNGPIPIDGGMTANPYFCQFLADALGRDIVIADQPEVTALGAAMLAAEAVGLSLPPPRRGRTIRPRALPDGAMARFSAARDAVQSLESIRG